MYSKPGVIGDFRISFKKKRLTRAKPSFDAHSLYCPKE